MSMDEYCDGEGVLELLGGLVMAKNMEPKERPNADVIQMMQESPKSYNKTHYRKNKKKRS